MNTPDLYTTVNRAAAWLNASNGNDRAELTLRILKVAEEAGEAAGAWIGATGQNPRKGITHTYDQVGGELADTALAALVAIASLGLDPAQVMAATLVKVAARLPATCPQESTP